MRGCGQPSSAAEIANYPRYSNRGEIDAHDLNYYAGELDKRASELFVQDVAQCKVEWWQVANDVLDHSNYCHARPPLT